jgi:hypothetical protein
LKKKTGFSRTIPLVPIPIFTLWGQFPGHPHWSIGPESTRHHFKSKIIISWASGLVT